MCVIHKTTKKFFGQIFKKVKTVKSIYLNNKAVQNLNILFLEQQLQCIYFDVQSDSHIARTLPF